MLVFEQTPTSTMLPSNPAYLAQQRLWKSPYQAMKNVLCEHRRGVLFLRGQLPSFYFKQIAQETVAKIDGIKQVVNAIEVNEGVG
jgi:osmotically-inducible protein OsmY